MSLMRRIAGFTLIELLITVVVLAILTAIAVPSYREFVIRSHRSDATVALTEIANLQEKFYSNNLRYAGTLTQSPGGAGVYYPAQSANGMYNLSVVGVSAADGYTLQAQATGSQLEDDRCQTLTLNGLGQKGSSPGSVDTCWRR